MYHRTKPLQFLDFYLKTATRSCRRSEPHQNHPISRRQAAPWTSTPMHSGRQLFLQIQGLLWFPLSTLLQASDGEASQVLGDFEDLRRGVLDVGVSGGPLPGGPGVLGSLPAAGCQNRVCALEELTAPARARVLVTRHLAVLREGLVASLEPPTLGRHEAPGLGVLAAAAHFPAAGFGRRLHLDVLAVDEQGRRRQRGRGPLPGGLGGGPSAGVRRSLPGSAGRERPSLPDSHVRTRFHRQCDTAASDASLPSGRSPVAAAAAACSAPPILEGGHFGAPGSELACSRRRSGSGRRVAPAPV